MGERGGRSGARGTGAFEDGRRRAWGRGETRGGSSLFRGGRGAAPEPRTGTDRVAGEDALARRARAVDVRAARRGEALPVAELLEEIERRGVDAHPPRRGPPARADRNVRRGDGRATAGDAPARFARERAEIAGPRRFRDSPSAPLANSGEMSLECNERTPPGGAAGVGKRSASSTARHNARAARARPRPPRALEPRRWRPAARGLGASRAIGAAPPPSPRGWTRSAR